MLGGSPPVECDHLLREAHAAIASGDPSSALRLVLAVLHATGGQAAAAPALNRRPHRRVLTQLTTDNRDNTLQELADLFARASLSSSQQDTGREGFLECALQDGSSFVCGRCGGVVLTARRAQHAQFWCQQGAGGERGDLWVSGLGTGARRRRFGNGQQPRKPRMGGCWPFTRLLAGLLRLPLLWLLW
ncbi:hypothetical protein TSOC_000636 [Tetrabaena socialis]|uniref:C2HC zinc finger plants domain-containing protein n=1 Tax=Tetrabaena socialis TaxID=47790 RepID=A0A2J8AIR0_9CHLO|nr:hypothetical protein TSOC_000636 [Tetrabaena socialis]|eukprot:PNH12409.1 hypothetical protein TSOC_000636 [Tetrabaena socialis]